MSGKTRTPEEQARRERFGHCGKYDCFFKEKIFIVNIFSFPKIL